MSWGLVECPLDVHPEPQLQQPCPSSSGRGGALSPLLGNGSALILLGGSSWFLLDCLNPVLEEKWEAVWEKEAILPPSLLTGV